LAADRQVDVRGISDEEHPSHPIVLGVASGVGVPGPPTHRARSQSSPVIRSMLVRSASVSSGSSRRSRTVRGSRPVLAASTPKTRKAPSGSGKALSVLATEKGLGQLDAGMNLARQDAYRRMVDRGFRTWLQGVTMHKPNEPGYSHPDAYVIDDWR
jgi:hypothetical protein